jgi:hypothetical protein
MMTERPTLKVEGDPNEVDSFVACVTAIATAWRHPVDYDYVAGLAGIVFSPVWDKGEDCTAWWMEGGDDVGLDFLGQALGFTSTTVRRQQDFSDEVAARYAESGELPVEIRQYLDTLRTALDSGNMVVMRTWPAWSVLAGWGGDVTRLPIVTVPGFEDLCASIWGPHKSQLAYIVAPSEPAVEQQTAVAAALKFGATVASGALQNNGILYGGALYEAAAERLSERYFCPSCKENDVGCAHRTLRRMLGSQTSAAAFVKTAIGILGNGSMRLHLENTADRYTAMAAVLSRHQDFEAFKVDWHDGRFRETLAADLRSVRALHDSAAKELMALVAAL